MVAYAELGKSGREVYQITREEVSMNAVEYTFDLRTAYSLHQENPVFTLKKKSPLLFGLLFTCTFTFWVTFYLYLTFFLTFCMWCY